jgi:hypothetical protein
MRWKGCHPSTPPLDELGTGFSLGAHGDTASSSKPAKPVPSPELEACPKT